MKSIRIDKVNNDSFIPTVDFDATSGVCEIEGEAFLDNASDFFSPLISWLKQFLEEKQTPLVFNIKLSHFNTSSSRYILEILLLINSYKEKGKTVTINWYYEKDNIDLLEEIEDFMFESGTDITLVLYQ